MDECIDYCSKYVDDDFYPEMEKIVRFVYSKPLKERYTYRYTTIADLLGFTDEDIRLSYCCSFSEERREEAKKRAKKKENEKKKAETIKRKETTINYVVENINLPVKELASNCNVSERTIYRIKESIRQQSSV